MYYCEVCFAVPLAQSFTYTYRPPPKEGAASETAYPQVGQRIFASLGRGRRKEGWIISVSQELPAALRPAIRAGQLQLKELEIAQPRPLFGPNELGLARWMAQHYICSLGEALGCILPTGKKEQEPQLYQAAEVPQAPLPLSAEQRAALAALCHSPQTAQPFYYLFGPTGSGKTEVFLQCMAHVLQQGKNVIYLVPEISLCYQLQEQLQHRFRQRVALLHSHLGADIRLWYWQSLLQGESRIALGARSAVFAPVPNLGLIILDEEHEPSYKATDTPRYHARQVAMRRCRDQRAILLMGSATPSVEALHACGVLAKADMAGRQPADFRNFHPEGFRQQQGVPRIQMLRLSERLAGGCFPQVEIIDLRRSRTMISDSLAREIENVSSSGDQAILFLNRRGYAPVVECFSCGKVQECRHCSVALAYHKKCHRLQCHHCGFSAPMASSCHYCHRSDLEFVGFGTEHIEEELQRYFGHLRIARLDTDISRKKGQSQKILQDFRAGRLDLLVGTQMVAKGLNFERVKLVGVLLADTSLNMPDFRAAERSFSLLVQVAGRAGRYRQGGKVLIQTCQPKSEVIQQAAALDWQAFYAKELELRQLTHYPPFRRLIRLVFRGGDSAKVQAEARLWHGHLQERVARLPQHHLAELFPPCECPYFRVAGKYRYHMLLRSRDFCAMQRLVREYFQQARSRNGVYVEVDVDPCTMM